MKSRKLMCVTAVALFAAIPIALASNTWYADGLHGSDNNDCKSSQTACKTIGHAISLAHWGDSIMVAAATYRENLSIGINLKVIGSGAATTIIDGRNAGTVITIPSVNGHVILAEVAIRDGSARLGGGVSNSGVLTITNSIVRGNIAVCNYNCFSYGGGINNSGTLILNNSTISGNRGECINRCGSVGGGISNSGALIVTQSTISQNVANVGGGIYNHGILAISNGTLSQNSANTGDGGSIKNAQGTASLQNSIVANSSGGNCSGTMTSQGYNLSSDNTCNFAGPGDLNNINPNLGPLQNNGGPTPTMALITGSPAIDAGNPGGCTDGNGPLLKTDQRGMPRPDKEDSGGCDMGAYERQSD